MDLTTQLPAIISAVVAVAGAGVSVWSTAQRSRQVDAEIDKTALDGFNALCEQLQKRIDANDRELAALKAELAQLRTENEVLRGRVRDLELENAALKKQLDELQKKRQRARKGT